jgi:hypothetical protein
VYSLTPKSVVTNRSEPDTAIAMGTVPGTVEMSDAFTVAPEVVYSPTLPLSVPGMKVSATKIASARAALVESAPSKTARSTPSLCPNGSLISASLQRVIVSLRDIRKFTSGHHGSQAI